MALEDHERAMQEFRRAVDQILDLIAAGTTGDPLDEALKHARELLDLVEIESVTDEDIEAALQAWREERARGY